jgi:protein phosphatase
MDDRFILCTDGLSDLVHEEEMKAVALSEEPGAACEKLIALAKAGGGYDNITVGVLHVKAAATTACPEAVSLQCVTDHPMNDVAKERPQ